MNFYFIQQKNQMDCGPTCLAMIAGHYGRKNTINELRNLAQLGKEGVNLYGISDAAEHIGFRTLSVQIPFRTLIDKATLPCIVHWNQNHFVVITPNSSGKK